MIENLPSLTPDAARGARTMSRCHSRLEAQRARLEAKARKPGPKVIAAERLVLVGACFAYLVSMVGNLLQIIDSR
jgi:hypothetical protein